MLEFYMAGVLEAALPAVELVLGGGAPQYVRTYSTPEYLGKIAAFDPDEIEIPGDLKSVADELIQVPNIANKCWIYTQYDSMVGAGPPAPTNPAMRPSLSPGLPTRRLRLQRIATAAMFSQIPIKGQ
jgi:phosphoribosylformylglycinamidine synthase